MSDATQAQAAGQSDARIVTLICYGLYLAAIAMVVTAIVGVVLAYIKRAEVRGSVWESHFTNLIHVFWAGVAATAICLAALTVGVLGIWSGVQHDDLPVSIGVLPAGYLAALLFLVWYLYRTIRGFLRAAEGRPYA